MHRGAARVDQHAVGQDEAKPHDVVGRLREHLVQIGYDAEDLAAENVEPDVLVGAGEHLARHVRHRCVSRDPGARPRVGQTDVDPGPAVVGGQRVLDLLARQRNGGAVVKEAIDIDDAGFRQAGDGLGAVGGLGLGLRGHPANGHA